MLPKGLRFRPSRLPLNKNGWLFIICQPNKKQSFPVIYKVKLKLTNPVARVG